MPATDTEHRLVLKSPVEGGGHLLITGFAGREEISRLFRYHIQMLSTNDSIAPRDIVGKNVTVKLRNLDGSWRFFNGFVSRFSHRGRNDRFSVYSAEVVPWLWFLTRTADCRIFQNKSVPQIIDKIFGDLGFSDYDKQIRGEHPAWDYCVQYRETDFNFISRLMEHEGIFYFFKHQEGKHVLVLSDSKSSHPDLLENSVDFAPTAAGNEASDLLTSWEHCYEFPSGKVAQTDYNFETPSISLRTQTSTIIDLDGLEKYEVYDYPGEYENKSDGAADTKLRMQEFEAGFDVVAASSRCRSFNAGGKFKIRRHQSKAEEGKVYVITSIQHVVHAEPTYASGGNGARGDYSNTFTCIPDSVPFRPARLTPKPVIQGSQTAVVVGPAGEELYTDDYGRVKVQFHWDREGQKNEKSSCWVRVSQAWAGNKWGAMFIPRIGEEVLVSFLEGDPDRPIITGHVYNKEAMPPYALPDNKTQSGFKSNSTKGGGGSNELRFEDKKNSEDIYFHAQKDFHRVVEHNDDLQVKNDQTIAITKNRTETVKEGDEQVTVEKGARTVNVDMGNDSHNIKQGDRAVKIDMGNDQLTIKMGNQTTKLDLGKSSTEAMQSIELKVGQSSIKVDQMGITIQGMMVKIEGQVQTQLKGLMTQINGDAMLQAKGGVTMIG